MERENARSVIFLKNNVSAVGLDSDSSLVMKRASNLSEDLQNDVLEMVGDHTDLSPRRLTVKRNRKKTVVCQSKPRRSARLKTFKK